MFNKDNNNQTSGDNSLNVLSGRDTHVHQIAPEVLRSTIMGVLWESFPRLRDEAINEAKTHVNEFINDVFDSLIDSKLNNLQDSLKNPDKFTTITETLYHVAKKTNKADKATLKKLLIDKINTTDEEDESNLIIDRAIDISARISKTHIAFLGFIHFIQRLSVNIESNTQRETMNFIHEDYTEIKRSNEVYICKNDFEVKKVNFHEQQKRLYKEYLLMAFVKACNDGLVKNVNQNYLASMGCFTRMYNGDNYATAISKNIGIDINSEQGKQEFNFLHYLTTEFGLKNIDDIESPNLTPVGHKIGEAFLSNYLEL